MIYIWQHALCALKAPGGTIQFKTYSVLSLGPDSVTNMEISEPVGKCAFTLDTSQFKVSRTLGQ